MLETYRDQPLHKDPRERMLGGEVQRALRHRIAGEIVPELPEDGAAERQVAEGTISRIMRRSASRAARLGFSMPSR